MKKFIFLTLLFISSTILSIAGGPWTQGKSEGIVIGNVSPVIYKTYSSANSDRIDMYRRVSDISIQGYFELGLTDKLLLTGNLMLKYVGTSNKEFVPNYFSEKGQAKLDPGKAFGMGNSAIGMKYRFTDYDRNLLFTASFAIEVPGSTDKSLEGLRTGHDGWTFLPGIHIGNGYANGIYFFVEGQFGARVSQNDMLSHEYRLNGEFGYDFKKPLVMAVSLSVKQSLNNEPSESESSPFYQTGLYLNNQEYIAWSFKFIYNFTENFGLTTALSGGATTKLIARTPVISGGLFYNWKGIVEE